MREKRYNTKAIIVNLFKQENHKKQEKTPNVRNSKVTQKQAQKHQF